MHVPPGAQAQRATHIAPRAARLTAMAFKCHTCDSTFATQRALTRHQLRHTRLLVCDVCFQYTSKDAETIVYHKRKMHDGTRPFACVQCDYGGRNAAALRAHVQNIHSDVRPFACGAAGCSFTTKTAWRLQQHAARHDVIMPAQRRRQQHRAGPPL